MDGSRTLNWSIDDFDHGQQLIMILRTHTGLDHNVNVNDETSTVQSTIIACSKWPTLTTCKRAGTDDDVDSEVLAKRWKMKVKGCR